MHSIFKFLSIELLEETLNNLERNQEVDSVKIWIHNNYFYAHVQFIPKEIES